MLTTLLSHGVIAILAGSGGYWLHYRFGATVAKDENLIKTAVQDIKKV